MTITITFQQAPGPNQIVSITYRVSEADMVAALALVLEQARQSTTVPIESVSIYLLR